MLKKLELKYFPLCVLYSKKKDLFKLYYLTKTTIYIMLQNEKHSKFIIFFVI